VSFEDDLMRNFGAADRMTKIMETFGLQEGEELEHPWLNKSVETAQKRVEQRNYMIRRRTLEFDDVMNQQREVVYGYRQEVIESEDPRSLILEVIGEAIPKKTEEFLSPQLESQDAPGLLQWINSTFPLGLTAEKASFDTKTPEEAAEFLVGIVKDAYEKKAAMEHAEALRGLERYVILNAVDRLWQEHLYAMDGLREAVYLRAFAQKDPLVEYKNEAFSMFSELMDNIKFEVLNNLFRSTTNLQAFEALLGSLPQNLLHGGAPAPSQSRPSPGAGEPAAEDHSTLRLELPVKREMAKVGRNDPCPCGSGKKYKSCCGRTA